MINNTAEIQPNQAVQKKKTISLLNKFLLAITITSALAGGSFMYYLKDKEVKDLQQRVAGASTSSQYQEILDLVGKIVKLPTDDKVSVAYIDNVDLLKKQNAEFYKDIEVGQYLIIFPKASKVIIYDKTKDMIINFSSYVIQVSPVAEDKIPSTEKPFNVEIRYIKGTTQETKDKITSLLQKSSSSYKISFKEADLDNYTGYTVVLLNRTSKPNMSQNIVAHTGINNTLEKLSEDESPSTADALIIIGKQN
jgi:hypothetical protein